MTPTQAAAVIGCSPKHVRTLIRAGKIRACKVPFFSSQGSEESGIPDGFYYDVTPAEAHRFRDTPKTERRGWPRGKQRSGR